MGPGLVVFEEVEVARGNAKLGGRGRGRSGSTETLPEFTDPGNGAPSPARNILPGEPFEPAAASFGHGPDPLMPSGWGANGPGFNSQAPLTWGADPSTAPLAAVGPNGHPGQPGGDPLDALQQYAGLPLGAGYGAAPAPDPSQVHSGYGATPTDSGFAGDGLFSGGSPLPETPAPAYVPHPSAPSDDPATAAFAAQPAPGQAFAGQPFAAQPFGGQPFEGQPYGAPSAEPQAFEAQPFAPQQFAGQQFAPQAFEAQPFAPQQFEPQPFEPQPFGEQAFGGQPFPGQPPQHPAQPFPSAPSAFPGFDPTRSVGTMPTSSEDPIDVTPASTVVPGSFDSADGEQGRSRRRGRSAGRRSRGSGHRPSDVENRSDLGLEAFTGPEASRRSAGARRPLLVLGVVAVLGAAGFIGYTQLSGTDSSLPSGPPVAVKPATARYPLPATLGTDGQIPAEQAKALKANWTALAKLTLPDLPPPLVVSAYGPAGAKPTTNVVVYAPGPQAQATYEALISSLSRPASGSSATVAKPVAAGPAGGQVMCGSQTGPAVSSWCAFTSPKGVGFVHVAGTAKPSDAAATTRDLRAFSER